MNWLRIFCFLGLLASHVHAEGLRVIVQTATASERVAEKTGVGVEQITTLIAQAIHAETDWAPVTYANVRSTLDQAASAALLGCSGVGCAVDVAETMEAQLILRTEIGLIGNDFLFSASLLDAQDARVVSVSSVTLRPNEIGGSGFATLVKRLVDAEENKQLPIAVRYESDVENDDGISDVLPQVELGRVLIASPDAVAHNLPTNAAEAFGQRLAARLGKEDGVETVTETELQTVLEQEAQRQLMGAQGTNALVELAAKLEAAYVVSSSISRFGSVYEVSASLIEQASASALRRVSLPVSSVEQLPVAAEVLAARLLGRQAELPKPPAPDSRFDDAVSKMTTKINDALSPIRSGSSKVAVVPFVDSDAFAKRQDLGAATTRLISSKLASAWNLPVVSPKEMETTKVDNLEDAQALSELGLEKGARALVVGRISRVGTDLLIEAQVIDVLGAKVLAVPYAFVPLGDIKSLIPAEALVLRTRADALFRAVVPGGGQFYNGPKHYWKGGIVLSGTVLSALGATALFAVAAERAWNQAPEYDRGGDKWIDECPDIDKSFCDRKRNELRQEARALALAGGGALTGAAVFYLFGFIDAAISTSDYSDLME